MVSCPFSPAGSFSYLLSLLNFLYPSLHFPFLGHPLTFHFIRKTAQIREAFSQCNTINPQNHLHSFFLTLLPFYCTSMCSCLSLSIFPRSGAWDRNFGICDKLSISLSKKGWRKEDKVGQTAKPAWGLSWCLTSARSPRGLLERELPCGLTPSWGKGTAFSTSLSVIV